MQKVQNLEGNVGQLLEMQRGCREHLLFGVKLALPMSVLFWCCFSWLLFTNITLFGSKEESFLYEGFVSSSQSFISFYTWYTNFQDQHSWGSIDGTTTAKHAIHSSIFRFTLKKNLFTCIQRRT